MKKILTALIAIPVMQFALAGSAAADKAAELWVEQAEDVMHHSCTSVTEESGDDPVQLDMIVQLMTAVSLYNRELDISEFAQTDEEKTELRNKFAASIEEQCSDDGEALLAGVVDRAVVKVLTEE